MDTTYLVTATQQVQYYGYAVYHLTIVSSASISSQPLTLHDGIGLNATAGSEAANAALRGEARGDTNPTESFTALIAWGDGTESAVPVEGQTARSRSSATIRTTTRGPIPRRSPSTTAVPTMQVRCIVTVSPTSLNANPPGATGMDFSANTGSKFDKRSRRPFTNDNPAHIGGYHEVTIDWGDGTTTEGDAKEGTGDGTYDVGSHVYNIAGEYAVVTSQDQSLLDFRHGDRHGHW